ncbi:hypothetical protein AMTR_s00081p00045240 [Amborella trichopoda]|uniref:Uncharacterized protein n=1 Tax=Amborella trichopoda TaxID=13333 RepID=W1P3M8_AMBTC|nr:hypothetical protein AMTR_s00081p00045240 [Amborella trichopoda]
MEQQGGGSCWLLVSGTGRRKRDGENGKKWVVGGCHLVRERQGRGEAWLQAVEVNGCGMRQVRWVFLEREKATIEWGKSGSVGEWWSKGDDGSCRTRQWGLVHERQ